MTLDWWTLGLQTVNVLILIWILARFLFKPVTKIIAERQAAATVELDKARAARAEAEATRNGAQKQTAALAERRAALLEQARSEAAAEKRTLISAARGEADKARAAGVADLARLRATQARELSDKAADLAADIATRLLARLPEAARVTGFIEGLAEAVADLPVATRAGIGADGPVRLKAAQALTGAETEQLTARLTAVLGRKVEIAVETDETLIAGLELNAPHAVVRNNFRADLDRVRQELTDHD